MVQIAYDIDVNISFTCMRAFPLTLFSLSGYPSTPQTPYVPQETVTVSMKQACMSKSPNRGNHLAFQATPISEDVSTLLYTYLIYIFKRKYAAFSMHMQLWWSGHVDY